MRLLSKTCIVLAENWSWILKLLLPALVVEVAASDAVPHLVYSMHENISSVQEFVCNNVCITSFCGCNFTSNLFTVFLSLRRGRSFFKSSSLSSKKLSQSTTPPGKAVKALPINFSHQNFFQCNLQFLCSQVFVSAISADCRVRVEQRCNCGTNSTKILLPLHACLF